jgi:SAM-dependent methyltransferase
MEEKKEFIEWRDYYLQKQEALRSWPDETLIRIFKGPYLSNYNLEFKDKNILDIGFGNGESFIFLKSMGLNIFGTEVDQNVCDKVSNWAISNNIDVDLRVGVNTKIPYPDNHFDYLVSWNVLHYEDNEEDILKGLSEYNRVLKPGGRIFISTTGPEHKILKDSEKLGSNRYLIKREDDMRKGQTFFYFDNRSEIKRIFSKSFKDILIGRTHSELFTDTLDWFIITAVKG